VAGGRLYTQEQRGDDEVVTCYDAATGEPLWMHRDKARFWESLAGAGPRATPTLDRGRVYTLGATGILNVLNGADGSLIWTRNSARDTGAQTPEWGFASSPLVVNDLVIVHTGAPEGKAVVAYDLADGEPRWFAEVTGPSYSSAHLVDLQGALQVVFLTGDGATGLEPETGRVLWTHAWPMGDGARIVQPAFTADGNLLIGTGFGMGVQQVRVFRTADGWSTEPGWTSTGLKPYFNDFVTHRGYAYGFDGRIMSCIDLADGSRKWKGGRYGYGQALLLPDQDLIIVLSEKGELALVQASPDGFAEIARVPAIQGKTWNHPVLVDGTLYVRNGQEMAAYDVASRSG
jgi:outer membrane protein assembly factor BamB